MRYIKGFIRKIIWGFKDMDHMSKVVFLSLFCGIIILGTFISWKYIEDYNLKKQEISASQLVQPALPQNNLELPTAQKPLNNPSGLGELRVDDGQGTLVDGIAQIVGGNSGHTQTQPSQNNPGNSYPSSGTESMGESSPSNSNPPPIGPQKEMESDVENSNSNNNSNASQSNPVTPSEADSPNSFSFGIIGDTQRFDPKNDSGGLQKAVKNLSSSNVEAVIAMGDLISSCDGKSGCATKYTEWKNVMNPILSKTKEVMGNHDRVGKEEADAKWQEAFDLPTNGPEGYSETVYSFDIKNSHFIVLNSEKPIESTINQAQRDWLEKDLSTNSSKDNIFVFYHEPAWPVSSKIGESLDKNAPDRDAFWEIIKKNKVTAVFSGHEHIMSRKKVDGINQFVLGNTDSYDHDKPKSGKADYSYVGRHYGIVKVDGKKITFNLYSVEGNLINSFEFGK